MDYSWANHDDDLLKACLRFQVCINEPPKQFSYTPFQSIMQDGPQCGLIALAMYCNLSTKEQIQKIYQLARELNFTINGEMFSAENMMKLTQNFTNKKVCLYQGDLNNQVIIEFLLNKGVLLVPYDADANHSPCEKNGHKAHWALISGIIINQDDEIFILARQGKSKHLGIWSLKDLSASNSQLNEFAPSRKDSGIQYKLPDGGVAGPKGLKGQSVLIYDEGTEKGRS